MKFLGQSFSQGPYQPKYQQVRKGFIYFVTYPPLNFHITRNRSHPDADAQLRPPFNILLDSTKRMFFVK